MTDGTWAEIPELVRRARAAANLRVLRDKTFRYVAEHPIRTTIWFLGYVAFCESIGLVFTLLGWTR